MYHIIICSSWYYLIIRNNQFTGLQNPGFNLPAQPKHGPKRLRHNPSVAVFMLCSVHAHTFNLLCSVAVNRQLADDKQNSFTPEYTELLYHKIRFSPISSPACPARSMLEKALKIKVFSVPLPVYVKKVYPIFSCRDLWNFSVCFFIIGRIIFRHHSSVTSAITRVVLRIVSIFSYQLYANQLLFPHLLVPSFLPHLTKSSGTAII